MNRSKIKKYISEHKKELIVSGVIAIGLVVGAGIGYKKWRQNMSYEPGMNMTVRDLKAALKNLPDDMEVIVTSTPEDDPNYISGFRHIRTAGLLKNPYEEDIALCIAPSMHGLDMESLLENIHSDTTCEKVLF